MNNLTEVQTMNTYKRNLETQKIELNFEKSTYTALSEEVKKRIKSNFLWSNYAGAWVSRAKGRNTYQAEQIAKELNLTFEGEMGEVLSFAEQVEREQQRAQDRAQRMEIRQEKAEQKSTEYYNNAKQIGSFIPMGQPILVGHHSEKRHRRDLDKIDNSMRKSCQEDDKAKYYENKVQNATYTAEGEKFKNVNYLLNRISDCNRDLRANTRSLEGKDLVNRATGEKQVNGCEISEQRREKLEIVRAEILEKLDFFTTKLKEIGGGELTAERIKEGQPSFVLIGKTWYPLKSINRDTVTVLNWLNIASFTWKFKFDQIKSMQSIRGTVIVYDRDNNEVKPTIKYK